MGDRSFQESDFEKAEAKGLTPFPSAPARRGFRGFRLRNLMIAIAVIAVVLWALCGFFWLVLSFGILLAFALVNAPVVIYVKLRTTRQEGLLRLLVAAAAAEVPPGPAVEAFGDLCGFRFRNKLRALAGHLDAGTPLPDALERVGGLVPTAAAASIRIGWEAGDPAGGLRDAVEAVAAPWHPHRQGVAQALAYGLGMLFVLQFIGGFVLYYVTPQFMKIYADFGKPLPQLTQSLIEVVNAVMRVWPLTVAFVLAELAFATLLLAMLASYVFGFDLRLPLVDRIFRRGHAAAIFRALALVVQGRRPMDMGLGALARSYPREWVRARLRVARERARQGVAWTAALRNEGLIRDGDAAVLDAAQRAGNLLWALRELAEGTERRSAYRARALAQTLLPLVVLTVGSVVGLFAAAHFLPLTTLIQELAG